MKSKTSLLDSALLRQAVIDSFLKLDPRVQWKNPVMFVVYIGSIITAFASAQNFTGFNLQITLWLWFTLLSQLL